MTDRRTSTKCYTGPGCRLHSATGITRVKRELDAAQVKILNAKNLVEMTEAQKELSEARKHYDLTEEGREELRQQIASEKDSNVRLLLANRLKDAELEAERLEAEEKELYENPEVAANRNGISHTITFNANHNYDVPEPIIVDQHTVKGPKMPQKYTPLKELKGLIRNDIAEAQKEGYLPKDVKITLREENGGWTPTLHVNVQGLSDKAIYAKELNQWGSRGLSPEARELTNRIEKITKAYGSFYNNGSIDEFNNSYYVRVNLEDEEGRKHRNTRNQAAKAKASNYKVRTNLKSSFAKVGNDVAKFKEANGLENMKTTPEGYHYAFVPGTKVLAVERYDKTRQVSSFRLYDLSTEEDPESLFDDYSLRARLFGLKRKRFLTVNF